jgi:hypothetical protein
MGEVLMRDEKPRDIWNQHQEMLDAVAKGDGRGAEELARQHVLQAAQFMINRLSSQHSPATDAPPPQPAASKVKAAAVSKGVAAKLRTGKPGVRTRRPSAS